MKESERYVKIIEWSDEDRCFVGTAPGLLWGGCHGDDEHSVFLELSQIVDEALEILAADLRPLPPPSSREEHSA